MKGLLNRLDDLITEAELESKKDDCFRFLPDIVKSLVALREGLKAKKIGKEKRRRMIGGLGRIITEDYSFSEGKLGTQLLNFLNDLDNIE